MSLGVSRGRNTWRRGALEDKCATWRRSALGKVRDKDIARMGSLGFALSASASLCLETGGYPGVAAVEAFAEFADDVEEKARGVGAFEEFADLVFIEAEEFYVGSSDGGGGARPVAQGGHLADGFAFFASGNHFVFDEDVDYAVDDDEQVVAGRAFSEDSGVFGKADGFRPAQDVFCLLGRESVENPDPSAVATRAFNVWHTSLSVKGSCNDGQNTT